MPALSFLPRDQMFSSFSTVSPATGRRHSVQHTPPPTSNIPPQPQRQLSGSLLDDDSDMIADYPDRVKRQDSLFSSGSMSPPRTLSRRNSALAAHRNPRIFNTNNMRSNSISESPATPSDDDLIIVTVRLSNKFRKSSVSGAEDLPSRPPARSFLRRMSTHFHLDHSAEKEERYKAIKMPRGEYRRHFARDAEGNYAGSEPEREWDEGDLMKEYGGLQDLPLTSTPLC